MTEQAAHSLEGKLAVVTGATAGVGLETALGLARLGASLIVTGRDATRLAGAVSWIAARLPSAQIETELADFARLADVRGLSARILARRQRIDILVNNAGLIMPKRVVTEDGFETTFQVNHLATFLLTHDLLPALKAAASPSAGARIVNVASVASKAGRIDFDDLNLAHGWSMWRAYAQSKLMNIMFTYALAGRLAGSGVTANALHPGFVASNFGNKGAASRLIWSLLRPFQISQRAGAENSIFAASSPEMEGVSGKYLIRKKAVRSPALSYDDRAVEKLWRVSAELTKVEA
jgi:NAD(P)-dependent dehydrogenase (short-subunit alcohol dehydrogenase family)